MRGLLSVLILATTAAGVEAQSAKIDLAPASSITVEGTSNVHAWHATSTQLTTSIQIAPPIGPGSQVESVTLSVPVRSLKSGKGGLDKNLYKALKAEQNPMITFVMRTYSAEPTGNTFAAVITGTLTVNGVEKEITASATMTGDAKAGLKAVGTATFKMTDFGVKPVTALLGTIRTGDQVTVKFDLSGATAQAVAALPND
jgi:polyisoprenoid-binding protein YceI